MPQKAQKIPVETVVHGVTLIDNYSWMRDRNWTSSNTRVVDKDVLNYLEDENQHVEDFFKTHQGLVETIYKELIGRVKLADRSVLIKGRTHYYFSVTNAESKYAIHMRQDSAGVEEVLLDENKEAGSHKYFALGAFEVNPTGNLMAYSIDTSGDERYSLFIKNLVTGELSKDRLNDIQGDVIWSEDEDGFYYTKLNDESRATKVYYHMLNTEQKDDLLVYEEKDPKFTLGLSKTSDYKYILLYSGSFASTEILQIPSAGEDHTPHMLIKRKENHLCSINHFNGYFYLRTNDVGKNFRLIRFTTNLEDGYEEVVPHSEQIYLTGFVLYSHNMVIETKEMGLTKIHILTYDLHKQSSIDFPDPAYVSSTVSSAVDDDGVIVYYSSMKTPSTYFKYDFTTHELRTLKVQEIPSGYNADEYNSERLYLESREAGIKIPVSLVYKKRLFKHDGTNYLMLYGYGGYGLTVEPYFRSSIISLLDRGFVYAIAHIRGGDDLGLNWYESAKLLNKTKSFEDFIDVAKGLIQNKYTSEGQVAIWGGSQGGQLVGAVINQEPGLFKAGIASVPYVDFLNMILDPELPLTTTGYAEHGDPREKEYFDYIRSYCPYQNVRAQEYPNLYVDAGITDRRVPYWGAAKWVAKLREFKTDSHTILLETDMNAGHGSGAGRFEAYRKLARKYAFVISMFAGEDVGSDQCLDNQPMGVALTTCD